MKEWLCTCGTWVSIDLPAHVHVSEFANSSGMQGLCSTAYQRVGTESIREQVQVTGEPADWPPCQHESIKTSVRAYRVTHIPSPPFMMEIEARCADCGTRFRFGGIPMGRAAPNSWEPFGSDGDRRLTLSLVPVIIGKENPA